MRLPQRVPWASISELEEVYSWVYPDSSKPDRALAVQRLSAWQNITALPHALESLLLLLVAQMQDEVSELGKPKLVLRECYSMAIIRLVNGFVDPLQNGLYARPIASIAVQLGLPSWFVELRHAATHENLPSLDFLRDACAEALVWLQNNYFLPTLNPHMTPDSQITAQSHEPYISRYKSLSKSIARDRTLGPKLQPEIRQTLRDIEQTIVEARISVLRPLDWADEDEDSEIFALESLCDALLKRGALVPVSRKKRTAAPGVLQLPENPITIWTSLLEHLERHHPLFPQVLITKIVSLLLCSSQSVSGYDSSIATDEGLDDTITYNQCIAGWVIWVIYNSTETPFLRERAFVLLSSALGPNAMDDSLKPASARLLLESICDSEPSFSSALESISSITGNVLREDDEAWQDNDVEVMDERLQMLLGSQLSQDVGQEGRQFVADKGEDEGEVIGKDLPPGWRRSGPDSKWRPCPIGVYVPL